MMHWISFLGNENENEKEKENENENENENKNEHENERVEMKKLRGCMSATCAKISEEVRKP